ncbi:hypothetical protein WR25_06427 [Diploscapter pachys]|uniref:Exonuclease domain-containing protein n=1 Tax=Diploscapter pachys TaxID=2018661 RepID=A0A2A2K9B8_9BILA|nr:hypothetical protein WR25_06427 [Diploscapter pachys]
MFRCFAFPCSSFSTSASRCAAKKLRQSINNLSNVPPKQQFWMNKPKPFMPTNFAPLGSSKPVAQDFDYLLVLDFEATCIENDKIQPVQEIIEFPVIAINTDGWKETAIFHQYVKPTVNPILTTYCTSLTGIIQEMVDNGKTLSEVLEDFDFWLEENQIKQTNFTFVSCGDWDLQLALPSECQAKEIEMPEYLTKWINVKKAYAEHTGEFPKGLKDLLARCNLTFEVRSF